MSQFITTVLAVQTAHGVRGRDAIYRISYYWQRLGGFGALGGMRRSLLLPLFPGSHTHLRIIGLTISHTLKNPGLFDLL